MGETTCIHFDIGKRTTIYDSIFKSIIQIKLYACEIFNIYNRNQNFKKVIKNSKIGIKFATKYALQIVKTNT